MTKPTPEELRALGEEARRQLEALDAIRCPRCRWPCSGCVDRQTALFEALTRFELLRKAAENFWLAHGEACAGDAACDALVVELNEAGRFLYAVKR